MMKKHVIKINVTILCKLQDRHFELSNAASTYCIDVFLAAHAEMRMTSMEIAYMLLV